jgi:hypothetical protein
MYLQASRMTSRNVQVPSRCDVAEFARIPRRPLDRNSGEFRYIAIGSQVRATTGRIYIISGEFRNTIYPGNQVQIYDPVSNLWNDPYFVAQMPTPRGFLAAARGADGRFYAFGGFTYDVSGAATITAATNAAEVYDPTDGTWSLLANMPTAAARLAATTGPDGRIYVLGGTDGTSYLSALQIYDPATNISPSEAAIPTPSRAATRSPWTSPMPRATMSPPAAR